MQSGLFCEVGVHPKLTECNIYVTMFLRVLKTFFLFLAWYSLFILAFGLGFFILLHTDRPELQQQANQKRESNESRLCSVYMLKRGWFTIGIFVYTEETSSIVTYAILHKGPYTESIDL
jgi:hypothetical protein